VVTASDDKTARVWDAETGQPLGQPLQHQDPVTHAAFSTDGRRVVTASRDATARVWDAETGQQLGQPLRHVGYVNHAEFSADGRRVVTASLDKTAQVWDAETGQPLGQPLRHGRWVTHATFSKDGRRVVTATDQTLTWWAADADGRWSAEETVWANGGYWKSAPWLAAADGSHLKIMTGDVLLQRDLTMNEAEKGLPELPGSGARLLSEYAVRFSLAFDTTDKGALKLALRPLFSGSRNRLVSEDGSPMTTEAGEPLVNEGRTDTILTATHGDKPGEVRSPYTSRDGSHATQDVSGMASGSLMLDLVTQKVFRVP
jgi:WD40 repeat protein